MKGVDVANFPIFVAAAILLEQYICFCFSNYGLKPISGSIWLLLPCYELTHLPQNSYTEALPPRTTECDYV